jgi:FkbM family methyltransferase
MSERSKHLVRRFKRGWKDLLGPLAYRNRSWAQEGEDLVLHRIFEGQRTGFYVDIGSHHPFRFSNSYSFYRRGWRGLCVDPLPGTRAQFQRWRPRDVALELGISAAPSTLHYVMFNEPALNTFSADLAAEREGRNNWRVIERRRIDTLPLAQVLQQHLPRPAPPIDFMSVDVEGMDLEVLKSNDWQRFRPRVVIAECLHSALSRWPDDPVVCHMRLCNYHPVAKTGHSVFFHRDTEELYA